LLIIHGNDDAMLTPGVASTLHQALLPLYREAEGAQLVQLLVVPGLAHDWTKPGSLEALRGSVGAWFDTYLTRSGQVF
jgi:dipeptidyl aminopeptidase/acylaminoacyl peptidase